MAREEELTIDAPSKRIRLFSIDEKDAEEICAGINNTDVSNLILLANTVLQVEEERKRIKKFIEHPDVEMFTVKITNEQHWQIIGTIGLHEIDWHSGNGRIGILIFKEFQGQGNGEEAVNALVEYAFRKLCFAKVYANIFMQNDRSQNIFYKCGFMPTGIRPKHYKLEGKLNDMIEMTKLNKPT
ncbi:MAG: GNAT family protein [Patescibacteria group bacterium]|nr:GNAT family N-acetyltransferase [Patescibacteria group bacterium]